MNIYTLLESLFAIADWTELHPTKFKRDNSDKVKIKNCLSLYELKEKSLNNWIEKLETICVFFWKIKTWTFFNATKTPRH